MKVASQPAKIIWCKCMGGWGVVFFVFCFPSWHLVLMTYYGYFPIIHCPLLAKVSLEELFVELIFGVKAFLYPLDGGYRDVHMLSRE